MAVITGAPTGTKAGLRVASPDLRALKRSSVPPGCAHLPPLRQHWRRPRTTRALRRYRRPKPPCSSRGASSDMPGSSCCADALPIEVDGNSTRRITPGPSTPRREPPSGVPGAGLAAQPSLSSGYRVRGDSQSGCGQGAPGRDREYLWPAYPQFREARSLCSAYRQAAAHA